MIDKYSDFDWDNFAKELSDLGITVSIEHGRYFATLWDDALDTHTSSRIVIQYTDIPEISKCKDSYLAKHYGVSVKQYRRWKEARRTGDQCRAKTQKGTPCQALNFRTEDRLPNSPTEWNPDKPVYCSIHVNKATNVSYL